MKRTGNAIIIVRPDGKRIPTFWPHSSVTDEPAWMTLDVENGEAFGRSLGIQLEFAFPARFVNDAMRSFRSEEGDRAWQVKILTIEDRKITKRKKQTRGR